MEDRSAGPPPKTYKLTASSISYIGSSTVTSIIPEGISSLFRRCGEQTPTIILDDVSFTAYPSEILAVVGPSGAGKSTLLDILAARTSPTTGSLMLNSMPMEPSSFRKLSAYVPQHDHYFNLLTVSETFCFTAKLLSSKSASISQVVESLLHELRLTNSADARLGGGLSDGERRRVSIGLSLLHDPRVLILDEPTSGLDSKSALNVMQTLRSIADKRSRTIILSIHQPGFKILSMIDQLLVLYNGSVIHHGCLASLHNFLLCNGYPVPPQLNPLEYAMEMLSRLHQISRCGGALSSSSCDQSHKFSSARRRERSEERIRFKSSRIHEIHVLHRRFFKIIYRTKQLLLANTGEALAVGVVLGTIFIDVGFSERGIEKRFGLFAFSLTFLLSSTTETLPIFISERQIILQETSSGVYRLSSYLLANTLVFLPYLLVLSLIFSASVYFLVGLCASWQAFARFVLITWAIFLMANSFVLFMSSITPNYIAGTSMVAMLQGGFFLFSGYFLTADCMPKYWLFMHFFSMYKYALDAFLINEYSCLVDKCFSWHDDAKTCMTTGADVLQKRGLRGKKTWTNISVLVGFFIFYRMLWLLVLNRRVSRFKT